MATISIVGNTLVGCLGAGSFAGIGSAMTTVKRTTNTLSRTLSELKNKVGIAAQAGDVSCSSASTHRALAREEQKEGALSLVYNRLDRLIADAANVDNRASTTVDRLKKDFYRKYSYLKPESEKGLREKAADLFKGAWDGLCQIGNAIKSFVCNAVEWCKEHIDLILKAVAVVVLLVVSIALLATGVGGILAAACWGCIFGIAFGFVSGGVESSRNGGSFWEGAINGALKGGIQGAITGAIFGCVGLLGGQLGATFGGTYKSFRAIQIAAKTSGVISIGMSGFDLVSGISDLIDPNSPLAKLNKDLHSNSLYNAFQLGVTTLAVFTGGAYHKAEITDGSHMFMNEKGEMVPHTHVKYQTGVDGTNYHFVTGGKGDNGGGLIKSAYAEHLDLKTDRPRLNHAKNTSGKLPGDDAGHIFADEFNGPPGLDGVTSQSRTVNRAVKGEYTYRSMELEWANALKNKGTVTDVHVKIDYGFGGKRPASYKVDYQINNQGFSRYFKNTKLF